MNIGSIGAAASSLNLRIPSVASTPTATESSSSTDGAASGADGTTTTVVQNADGTTTTNVTNADGALVSTTISGAPSADGAKRGSTANVDITV